MKRALLAVTLLASSSAYAGGYVGVGIGTGPALNSEDADLTADGRSAKVLGGFRFGRFAVEGAIGGFDMVMANAFPDQESGYFIDMYQASVSAKYNLPLGDGFELFGRLGLARTWLKREGGEKFNAEGDGGLVGIGIEYALPTAVTKASIWIDYQYTRAALEGDLTKVDLSSRMWTLGATIGF